MRKAQIGAVAIILGLGAVAFGQESEFQNKMQEDLDYYKPQLVNNCGVSDALTVKYVGKLGSNPRERKGDNWAPSTICGMAMDAVVYSCQTSEPVKKAISKVKSFECVAGSGSIDFKLKGSDLQLVVDIAFKKKVQTADGPKEDLVARLKKELDK